MTSIDDEDNDFILDALSSESVPVVYGDDDLDGIPDGCFLDKPSVAADGRTISYMLNYDDCNDSTTFSDDAETLSVASKQNPETIWYADFDGDLYGADDVINNVTYLDDDKDCFCQSDCGQTNQCFGYDNNGKLNRNMYSNRQ